MCLRRFLVKLADALANFIGSYSNDRIIAGIVIVSTLKDVNPDRPFFKLTGMPRQRLLHDVIQESFAAAALNEDGGHQHCFELCPDRRLELRTERTSFRSYRFRTICGPRHLVLAAPLYPVPQNLNRARFSDPPHPDKALNLAGC